MSPRVNIDESTGVFMIIGYISSNLSLKEKFELSTVRKNCWVPPVLPGRSIDWVRAKLTSALNA